MTQFNSDRVDNTAEKPQDTQQWSEASKSTWFDMDRNNNKEQDQLAGADVLFSSQETAVSDARLDQIRQNDPAIFQDAQKLSESLQKYVDNGMKAEDKKAVQDILDKHTDEQVYKLLDAANGLLQRSEPNKNGEVMSLTPGAFNSANVKDNQQEYSVRLVPKAELEKPGPRYLDPEHVETKDGKRVIFGVTNGGLQTFLQNALGQALEQDIYKTKGFS